MPAARRSPLCLRIVVGVVTLIIAIAHWIILARHAGGGGGMGGGGGGGGY